MASVASELPCAKIESVATTLRGSGFPPVAQVPDTGGAIDLAIPLSAGRLSVVRCLTRAAPNDHTALATMISEGDFIWGAIVYSESALPDPLGLIESFHIDQLDELVARLTELREALREAG